MFAVIRNFKTSSPGLVDQIAKDAEKTFVPVIRAQAGFVDYYLFETGSDTYATISVFEERDQALASTKLAADWLKKNAPDIVEGPIQIVSGDVKVHGVPEGLPQISRAGAEAPELRPH